MTTLFELGSEAILGFQSFQIVSKLILYLLCVDAGDPPVVLASNELSQIVRARLPG